MNFWPKSCLRFCHAFLNEISGVCEKIVPVSESFWSNFKFLRMIDLTGWLWGWNVRVNGLRSLFSFQPFVLLTVDDSDVSATVYGIFESVLNWFLAVLNVFFTIYKIRILSRVKCVILLSFLPKRSKSLKIVSNSALIVESSIFVKNDQKLTGFRVIKMILFQYFLEASLWFASHLNSSFLTPHLNTRPGVSWSRFKLKKTYQSFPILCFSFYL